MALAISAINCSMMFELMMRTDQQLGAFINGALFPLLVGPVVLAGWAIADRADHSAMS